MPRLLTLRVSADEFTYKFGLLSCNNDEPISKKTSKKSIQTINSRTRIEGKKSVCSVVPTERNPENQHIYNAIFCDESDNETSEHSDDVDLSLFDKDTLKSINLTNKSNHSVIVLSDTAIDLKSKKVHKKDKSNAKHYKCL